MVGGNKYGIPKTYVTKDIKTWIKYELKKRHLISQKWQSFCATKDKSFMARILIKSTILLNLENNYLKDI